MPSLLLVVTSRWTGRVKRTRVKENIFCICMQQGKLAGHQCYLYSVGGFCSVFFTRQLYLCVPGDSYDYIIPPLGL